MSYRQTVRESVRKYPPLLRRWRRALGAPSGASHNTDPLDAHRVRQTWALQNPTAPAAHLDSAASEVHAARVAMRNALLALDEAISHGEALDPAFRRLIHTEITGTREEAALLAARLTTVGPHEMP
ncbi:MAG TPA: hypothetical protein VGP16_23680 [Asanoa sp.]|jgi:hypothetical protein|nr:hypothetical protein [Asanoa sp.]